MRVLSLFSGGGLGDYGLTLAGMEIVGQVEIDDYCQKILALRWPEVPKWRDIREVKGKEIIERCGRIDLVAGGFPCQPYSTAARGRNNAQCFCGEMLRLVREIGPDRVLAENVTEKAIRAAEKDLKSLGYKTHSRALSASDFGADHKRLRWWLFAHSDSDSELYGFKYAEVARMSELQESLRYAEDYARAVRTPDGSPNRMDRLKMLGNGQVVQVVEWIGRQIMKAEARESLGGGNG